MGPVVVWMEQITDTDSIAYVCTTQAKLQRFGYVLITFNITPEAKDAIF